MVVSCVCLFVSLHHRGYHHHTNCMTMGYCHKCNRPKNAVYLLEDTEPKNFSCSIFLLAYSFITLYLATNSLSRVTCTIFFIIVLNDVNRHPLYQTTHTNYTTIQCHFTHNKDALRNSFTTVHTCQQL